MDLLFINNTVIDYQTHLPENEVISKIYTDFTECHDYFDFLQKNKRRSARIILNAKKNNQLHLGRFYVQMEHIFLSRFTEF